VFFFVAPVGELSKVAATWPAFLSHHFAEPFDGVVFPSQAALGYSAVDIALSLHAHPMGGVWVARALLSVPAHVFFACVWGYSLGRAKQGRRRPGSVFPLAWIVATAVHGLYEHIVFGRGQGALIAAFALLLAMGGVTWLAWRDLRQRGDRPSRRVGELAGANRLSRVSVRMLGERPSLDSVRAALEPGGRPIMVRWILGGALVTLGAMVAGVSASIALGHWMHVDFAAVDEYDAVTAAPLALLSVGLLCAFPVGGFLVARASNVPTLVEPALASALAIGLVCVVLGLIAPVGLVFAFAFSPVAFGPACAGAWAGLPTA
jgi:hypothetical protein